MTMPAGRSATSKWLLMLGITGFIFVTDQASKYLAVAHLTVLFDTVQPRPVTVGERVGAWIAQKDLLERGLATAPVRMNDTWWQWRYTQNRGAAWGFLAGSAEKFRVPFFHFVTLAAIVFILSYYRKLLETQRYMQVALALLLGGALGNGLDRVLRGYVIDFIDWHWFDPSWFKPHLHWPTFNVADCGVSIGLVMLFLEMLFAKQPAAQSPDAKDAKKA